jgi:cysteine-rich repeat protein
MHPRLRRRRHQGVRYGFRVRRGALDRIANRRRSSRVKTNDVNEANHRIAMANLALRDALVQRCNSADFESLYGITPVTAVELLASRSACLATQTYPVDAYECPPAVCGNGMRETGERCDDGNTEAGDGCSAGCQIEF